MTAQSVDSLEVLIAPEHLAYLFGIQVETLARWRRLSIGPKWYRVGRQIRYSETAAIEWLQSQSATAERARLRNVANRIDSDVPVGAT